MAIIKDNGLKNFLDGEFANLRVGNFKFKKQSRKWNYS